MNKQIRLLHPLHEVPAVAVVQGNMMKNGRYIGLELLFPDGHLCQMSFAEISKAQAAAERVKVEAAP